MREEFMLIESERVDQQMLVDYYTLSTGYCR